MRLRFVWHIVLALLTAAAVAAGAGGLLWAALGQPDLHPAQRGPLSPADIYNGIKIALTVVAGIGGVIALVVAYRKQRFAEREHARAEAAARREDTKLYTDRFGKAADQLGSDKAAVRLAGVHAMADLADDWKDGRQVCIDVLCAYLRMPYTPPPAPHAAANATPRPTGRQYGSVAKPSRRRDPQPQPADPARDPREERQVRHTAIRLIGAHLGDGATADWRGHDFDFTGAVFDGGSFTGIQVTSGRVSFHDAQFAEGRVDFAGIQVTGGRLSFSSAKFAGGAVGLADARFAGGFVSFDNAQFTGGTVDLDRAEFTGGTVSFHDAQFAGSIVSFGGARFSGGLVDLLGARFTTSDVHFGGTEFTGGKVDFAIAYFVGGLVSFYDAHFSGGLVSFDTAHFAGSLVSFENTQFTGGTVDISRPRSYLRPPRFDNWDDGPPDGLRLPTEV